MLTKAAREVLAFIHLTTYSPPGTHLHTWASAVVLCESSKVKYGMWDLKPGVDAYKGSTLWAAHEALKAAGFRFEGRVGVGKMGRYLYWLRVDADGNGWRAGFRHGSKSVWFRRMVEHGEVYRGSSPSGTAKGGWVPPEVGIPEVQVEAAPA